MKDQKNLFKQSLKVDVNPSFINDVFDKLDLQNLPSHIKCNIDDTYLKIKLAENSPDWDEFSDENEKLNSHLIFKIPLKEESLNYYYSSPLLEDLSNRYELYSIDYKDKIIDYSERERKFLQENFPTLIFNIKIRMKSKSSYEKKLNDKIKNQENVLIDDIIAERIIISSFNGSTDSKVLEDACYEVAKALYDFRINTNFKMKKVDVQDNDGKTDKPYLTKDYISHPKEKSGYQSLHIRVKDETNPDCCYETQIRTYDMEYHNSKNSDAAHKKYKPRLLNDLSIFKVPKYSEVTNFFDESGQPIILNVSTRNSFYHFYNVPFEKYKSELNAVEKFVSFKDLRKKLKSLIIDKENMNKDKETR